MPATSLNKSSSGSRISGLKNSITPPTSPPRRMGKPKAPRSPSRAATPARGKLPSATTLLSQTFANCPQNALRAFNKIVRLRKYFAYGILQRQSALGSLSLGDVPRKATSVNKLFIFAVNTGVNADVLYPAILASQSRLVILEYFAVLQARENIHNSVLIDMKLEDMMSFIFLASVAKHIQLGLIDAQHGAIRTKPVQANCGVLEEIGQLSFVAQQRSFHILPFSDVSLDADVYRFPRLAAHRER